MFARIRERAIALRQKIALSNKKLIGLVIVLLTVIALPLIVIASQQEQDLRQHASELVSPPVPVPSPVVSSFKKALEFNGIDGRFISYVDNIPTTDQMTVEAWVNPATIQDSPNEECPILISKLSDPGWPTWLLTWGPNIPRFNFLTKIGTTLRFSPEINIIPNTWSHIAYALDKPAGVERFFINGKKVAESSFDPSFQFRENNKGISIGAGAYSPQLPYTPFCFYKGLVDEVRISNSTRYVSDFVSPDAPFISDDKTAALWHFDNNLSDASLKTTDGVIIGGVQFADSVIILPAPTSTPTPSPSPTPTPVPLPISNPVNWKTDYVSLQAHNFFIKIDNRIFKSSENFEIHSDPGKPTLTTNTLELRWFEADKTEMRLFIYFSIDANNQWKVTEMRTYDGKTPGNWLYYLGGESGKLGVPFANSNYSKQSKDGKGYVNFGKIKLEPFLNLVTPTPKPSITVLYPNGGEKWEIGKTYNVTWNYSGPSNCTVSVGLFNYKDYKVYGGNSLPIFAYLGKYSFTASSSIPQGEKIYKIEVNGGKTCGVSDQSDNFLSVVAAPTPTPDSCTACAADVNGSGTVDAFDLQTVNRCFGKKATVNCVNADVIKDGIINTNDTACVNSMYNKKCVK